MNLRTTLYLLGIIFYGITVQAQPEKFNPEESIEQHRKGQIIIKGEPGATVQVKQQKHEFWFGCALASPMFSEHSRVPASDIKMYKEKFLENFNSAVTENAVKWGSMERIRGEIDYQTSINILDWTEANNIPCRGHNLYWGIEKFIQPWVKELNDDELEAALKKRGIETARHFKGRFAEYDLNNEMIHGNYYEKRLGEGITKDMANWVLEGDRTAQLWLNDYDILTGNRLDDFVAHAKKMQSMGVPVAGLGVQGHLHGNTFDREKLQNALQVLSELNLPVKITEFNMPGQRSDVYQNREKKLTDEQEQQKAHDLVDYYTICFANPTVEGILMWGFWAGANWIPQSSLYKRDWSPTPALKAYQELIFDTWWTDETVKLDANGEAILMAFYGDYIIQSGNEEMQVSHLKKNGKTSVKLK